MRLPNATATPNVTPFAASTAAMLAGIILAISACGTAPPASPAAGPELERLIDQYIEARRAPGRGAATAATAFRAQIDADRSLLADLEALDEAGLTAPQSIDRRALAGILAASVQVAERRRIWENDPSIYVPSRSLGGPLDVLSERAPKDRVDALLEAFETIPRALEDARANLGRPPRRFVDAALFETRSSLDQLREAAPALAAAAAPEDAARLESALPGAIAALEQLESFLTDEILPRADGDWRLGADAYDFVLQRRWFLDATAETIRQRGLDAFAAIEGDAQAVAERIAPGRPWIEVYESLKDSHPATGELKQAYQTPMDAAQAFVREHEIVTLPDGEHVVTVDTPPAMRRASPFGTFQTVDPFGDGLEGRLVLTPIEDWMSAEQRAERLRSHHTSWLPVIAVHEAYPGHHVQALKVRENPRPLRRILREPILSEGWGLYTEQLMFDLGFLSGDDVRLTVLRNRLWRAARVILDSSLHTGRMDFDAAVDFLVDRVRFERYAAELEVGMYVQRPTYVLGYLIGMQEIEAIHRDWVARFGEPEPPSELWDAFLRIGALPPALVREELFAQ